MLIVQKFGGTSVGSPERIHQVADRISERHQKGDRVVAVVSAMGATTDQLTELAKQITDRPSRREMDMLLTAGERITMSLLSMALNTRDVPAISFTGSQSGIITDTRHSLARILEIRPIRIGPELEKGKVVIVAGFQGVSREKEVTTLGRGGSDTTAVALALGLEADNCEIFTDVPGVMTADPAIVPKSRLLERISWDTMLELSCCGAGVLHSRAVELARRKRVPLEVRSAFNQRRGTMVEGVPIEQGPEVAAISGHPRVARVHITNLTLNGEGATFFETLDDLLDNVAGLHQYEQGGTTSLSFHIPVVPEGKDILDRLKKAAADHGGSLEVETDHAAVSVVGTGVLDAPSVIARAHRALAAGGIFPASVVTGNLSVTFLVPHGTFEKAQQSLHTEFLEV